jgi:hypothetical protein
MQRLQKGKRNDNSKCNGYKKGKRSNSKCNGYRKETVSADSELFTLFGKQVL